MGVEFKGFRGLCAIVRVPIQVHTPGLRSNVAQIRRTMQIHIECAAPESNVNAFESNVLL